MASRPQPLVSIVSLTYNRCRDVIDLLSVLEQQDYAPLEIIVIDNASDDGAAEKVAQDFPNVNLIRNQQNVGMVAYNTVVQRARGQYILFIDDDGLPDATDWVSRIVSCFQDNPRLGAIACQVRLAETGELAPDNPQHLYVQDGFGGCPCPAFVCTGAGVRASAIKTTGLFPDFFFRSYMEFTLSTMLWDAGWQVRYFPDIEVLHKKSPSGVTRAYDYWGLRNYYWYVWMLYPWPAVLEETLHHTIHSFRLVVQKECSLKTWSRALGDAMTGYGVAKKHRRPVSRQILGWLYQLRGHRRPSFFTEVMASGKYANAAEKKV